ncbi:hypothetical protein K431DRAFT_287930 [Polychaeton citri CBS 116435]|uniref:Uncharacterized protein n=1 Tax=Polychaeton citri CBS 116435 TaxID=1314669 RepID=A0A9P4Q227_9PEZI|nr:hypothetical protein K431DRAFT_287930 [Polychaeton citri CBS 116435]
MAPYRPSGSRSHRSGRNQAEQEVFEGLPVKQWTPQYTRQSLVPPAPENEIHDPDDRWNREPPMPRDAQMLQPWTYELLRLARSGKIGRKRKTLELDDDGEQVEGHDALEGEGVGTGGAVGGNDDRGGAEDKSFIVKKWRPVSEHALVPEHKHLEFLAKRRRGLPSLYGGADVSPSAAVSMRKTRVQRPDPVSGDMVLYEVLVPEGSSIDGEIITGMDPEVDSKSAVAIAPGAVVEGLGVANEEGILVAEHLRPSVAPRRNRPPPKKKGGPGRGKKRVTFTNPDGTTYTTIVPNATKIVPQPGQTVKHVAKGEEAAADVSAAQAAAAATVQTPNGGQGEDEGGEDDGSDDEEGDDDDDDREEGEVSDNDAPQTAAGTPARSTPGRTESSNGVKNEKEEDAKAAPTSTPLAVEVQQETKPDEASKDTEMTDDQRLEEPSEKEEHVGEQKEDPREEPKDEIKEEPKASRSTSSSPEVSLAKVTSASHSRQNSLVEPPAETAVTNSGGDEVAQEHETASAVEKPQQRTGAEDEDEQPATEAGPGSDTKNEQTASQDAVEDSKADAQPSEPERPEEAKAKAEAEAEAETAKEEPTQPEQVEKADEAKGDREELVEQGERAESEEKGEQEEKTDQEEKGEHEKKVEQEEKVDEGAERADTAEVVDKAEVAQSEEGKEEDSAKKIDGDGDIGMSDADPEPEAKANSSHQDSEKQEDEGDDLLGGLEADLKEQKKDDEK